jgi:hypothetical protein
MPSHDGSECVRVRQDLAIAESKLRDYREPLGKPFTHSAYLSELTSLRNQLKGDPSATVSPEPSAPQPPARGRGFISRAAHDVSGANRVGTPARGPRAELAVRPGETTRRRKPRTPPNPGAEIRGPSFPRPGPHAPTLFSVALFREMQSQKSSSL